MNRENGKWIVALAGLDLSLKALSVRGEYAVINQGITGGVVIGSEMAFWILIPAIFIWLYRHNLGLILAGGVANVVSRVMWGGVVDYFNFFGLFWFNLADVMIVGGLIVYGAKYFFNK